MEENWGDTPSATLKAHEIKKNSKIYICSLVQNTFIVSQQL